MRFWTLSDANTRVIGISIKRKTLETILNYLEVGGFIFFIMLYNFIVEIIC